MTDPNIPTREQQKAQGAECPCRGFDDYCPCQNVVFTTRKSEKTDTMDALLSERDALAARVERLEEVSAWHERQRQDALNRADRISAAEDPEVLRLCKLYGFGAVMDSASRQWVKIDRRGALFIGGSVGDTSARAALQENPHD